MYRTFPGPISNRYYTTEIPCWYVLSTHLRFRPNCHPMNNSHFVGALLTFRVRANLLTGEYVTIILYSLARNPTSSIVLSY